MRDCLAPGRFPSLDTNERCMDGACPRPSLNGPRPYRSTTGRGKSRPYIVRLYPDLETASVTNQSRTSNRSQSKRTSFRACRGILPESSAPPTGASEIPWQARNDVLLYPVTCAWALKCNVVPLRQRWKSALAEILRRRELPSRKTPRRRATGRFRGCGFVSTNSPYFAAGWGLRRGLQ